MKGGGLDGGNKNAYCRKTRTFKPIEGYEEVKNVRSLIKHIETGVVIRRGSFRRAEALFKAYKLYFKDRTVLEVASILDNLYQKVNVRDYFSGINLDKPISNIIEDYDNGKIISKSKSISYEYMQSCAKTVEKDDFVVINLSTIEAKRKEELEKLVKFIIFKNFDVLQKEAGRKKVDNAFNKITFPDEILKERVELNALYIARVFKEGEERVLMVRDFFKSYFEKIPEIVLEKEGIDYRNDLEIKVCNSSLPNNISVEFHYGKYELVNKSDLKRYSKYRFCCKNEYRSYQNGSSGVTFRFYFHSKGKKVPDILNICDDIGEMVKNFFQDFGI